MSDDPNACASEYLRGFRDGEASAEAEAEPPVKYTAEEMAEIVAEVAAHPRRHVIEAIADTTYEIDNDSTEGGGGGMTYHLERAYSLVDAMPELGIDESSLCEEPGCGAHPPYGQAGREAHAAAEARGRQAGWTDAVKALRDLTESERHDPKCPVGRRELGGKGCAHFSERMRDEARDAALSYLDSIAKEGSRDGE